jgi:hypothetical protein
VTTELIDFDQERTSFTTERQWALVGKHPLTFSHESVVTTQEVIDGVSGLPNVNEDPFPQFDVGPV